MNIKKYSVALVLVFFHVCVQSQTNNNIIHLGDPTIFYYDGTYYLYGTGAKQTANGFVVYCSKDLKKWEGPCGNSGGYALKKGDSFGTEKFWAPQVFQYKGKFYMAYTANEHVALASSDSPRGPFKQVNKTNLIEGQKQIDPFVFIDENGKKYLYHVIVANGGNRIYVAELEDDMSGIKENTLTKCIEATETWENTENADWSVTEGPTVVKHKGTYYLIYSANHFKSKDYAVGYAISKSPMGPWIKYQGSPVISMKNISEPGAGHGDLFRDKTGSWKYVFHTHFSDSLIAPRRTGMVDAYFKNGRLDEDEIEVKSTSFYFLKMD